MVITLPPDMCLYDTEIIEGFSLRSSFHPGRITEYEN